MTDKLQSNLRDGDQKAARDAQTLERQIMDASIAKNDAEWWAMEEIKRLRQIEGAALRVVKECEGDLPPSLGSMASLADALHSSWRARRRIEELMDLHDRTMTALTGNKNSEGA